MPLHPLHRLATAATCALSLGLGAALLAAGDGHAAAATKKERTALSKECSAKADAHDAVVAGKQSYKSKRLRHDSSMVSGVSKHPHWAGPLWRGLSSFLRSDGCSHRASNYREGSDQAGTR